MPRSNWLDLFLKVTQRVPSPEIFRKWVAFSVISALLQRRVFLVVRGEKLFCNLYVALVGPPAVGKTRAIRIGFDLVRRYENVRLFPQKTTGSKAISAVVGSFQTATIPGDIISMCAISGFFDELANFIQPRDYSFMVQLTDWYDCPKAWLYDTRTRGEERAENIYVSFVGGITPKTLANVLGQAAFGMGFTSRLNLIFSEDTVVSDPFENAEELDLSELYAGTDQFSSSSFEFSITSEAKELVREWVLAGMPPLPADSRFAEYNPRRWLHWLKLGMIHAVAENSQVIEEHHLKRARDDLLEAEFVMPLALEYFGNNPMAEAVKNLHSWAMTEYVTNKRQPISEGRLLRKLMADIPQQYHGITLEHMINSGMLKVVSGQAPSRNFIPCLVSRD